MQSGSFRASSAPSRVCSDKIKAGNGAADPVLAFKSKSNTLGRVVEYDADCVPHAAADAAHAVAEVHAVVALRALHRPVMHSEGHSITLPKRHDLDATLHARPLLG
jgi:hypothetical protein